MYLLYLLCHSPATDLPDSSMRVSFNRLQLISACEEEKDGGGRNEVSGGTASLG